MPLFIILIIISKLLNECQTGLIFEKVINTKKKPLNVFQKSENLKLAIASAKSLGIVTTGLHPGIIMDGDITHILGILWQLLKLL